MIYLVDYNFLVFENLSTNDHKSGYLIRQDDSVNFHQIFSMAHLVATLLLTLDAVVLATEIFSTTDIGIAYVAFLDSPTSFNSWEIETNGDSLNLGTTFTADGIRAGGTVEFVQGDDLVLHVPANTTLRVTKKGSKIVTRGYRSGPLLMCVFKKRRGELVAPFLLPFLLMRWSTSFADRFYCISRLPVQVTGTLVITDLTFTVDSDYRAPYWSTPVVC